MTGVKNENQFLYMGVPITGAKGVHRASSNPQPIVVEKLTGKYVTPSESFQGGQSQVLHQEQLGAYGGVDSDNRGTFCPRDTLEQAHILAQLDMKKKKRNPETTLLPFEQKENENAKKIVKPIKTKQRSQVKVYEVNNKPQKNASVQVSCVQSQRKSPEPTPLSQLPPTTNSPPTRDKEPNNQEIQRLQGEISKQLRDLKDLLDSLVKECNDSSLAIQEEEEEMKNTGYEQGALRTLTRQVYIVQQQVAEVERKLNAMHNYKMATRIHANKLDYTKSRLTSAYRGVNKSLQGITSYLKRSAGLFMDPVFHLRLVDLLSQLLQSVRKLFDLYLQLTSLFSKNYHSTCTELLDLLDITDALQAEWQVQLEHKLKRFMSNGMHRSISPGSSRKKSNSKHIQNFQRQRSLEVTSERKSVLQKSSKPSNPSRAVLKTTRKPSATKKPAKSVLFPSHIQVHRKPNEVLPNQNTYADSTLSSRMKSQFEVKPEEEKSESLELRQRPLIVAGGREEQELTDLPGFGGQPLSSNSVNKVKKNGESIIEELLALESKQRKKQEAKIMSPTVNNTQEENDGQQVKSVTNLHFTDKELRSLDLNLPPLEVLLHRLKQMENEQIQIRSRWASLKYHDTEAVAEECGRAESFIPTGNHQPHSPSPIFFSKKAGPRQTTKDFQDEQPQFFSKEFPGAIRFTKTASKKNYQQTQIKGSDEAEDDERENRQIPLDHLQRQVMMTTGTIPLDYQGRKPKRLFLSNKILRNISENKQRFTNYLLNSAYHQVESFDPWRLTEELADLILDDCIQEVSEEMQDLSCDLVHHLFNNEFIQFPSQHRTQQHTDCPAPSPPSLTPLLFPVQRADIE